MHVLADDAAPGVSAPAPAAAATATATAIDPDDLFQKNCALCHGPDRVGRMGPALLPQSLERLSGRELDAVLRQGRVATQMQGFAGQLSEDELNALAHWLRTAPAQTPQWTRLDMDSTHWVEHAPGTLPAKPVFKADARNLFVVVEAGDHHLSMLDGGTLEPMARFPTHFALHGGPKFSPDGRYVYVASRDGWITKYDLWNLVQTAEIRVALNTRNLAVSDDGRWVLAGNTLPETLVLMRASDLEPVRVYPVTGADGKPSRVSAVYDAAPRHSFIVALKDTPAVWEIGYARKKSAAALTPRKLALPEVLDDFYFDQRYRHILGASRAGSAQVIDLNSGRRIAQLDLSGMPHLGSGITWRTGDGGHVMASPNLKKAQITVIDMDHWKTVAEIQTNGPGFFIRSHEQTPYAWTDAMMGPKYRDTLQIIDKRTFKVAGSVTPSPGKTAAHVEFTRDGRYALVSLMAPLSEGGAIVVYDAATWREVKRIPMSKPVGKYNVYNKTMRSSGTSH
ncbi:MAG: nitrite reductase [Burkholderiaceae bacterium]|nr:nitrite reductase [Burkholderiaceae bacterium]